MNEDTRTVIQILESLAPSIDMQSFLSQVGGRQWYFVTPGKRDMAAIKQQIRRDPCRDYKILKRRYRVSAQTIYRVWGEKAG